MNQDLFDHVIGIMDGYKTDPRGRYLRGAIGQFIQASRGDYPSNTELDACVDSLAGTDAKYYRLCNTDGLPFEGGPEVCMVDCEVESANEGLEGIQWRALEVLKAEQAERDAKAAAERAVEQEKNRWCLTAQERGALNAFAHANGRCWKRKLRTAWENATAEPTLQYLRNHKCFGPEGLVKFKAV